MSDSDRIIEPESYEKLKGKGTQGDFVLQNQEVASKEGFNHVSKIWYNKTISYDELNDKMADEARHRKDFLARRKNIQVVNEDGAVRVKVGDYNLVPTEHALTQLAVKFHVSTYAAKDLLTDRTNSSGKTLYKRDDGDRDTLVNLLRNGMRRIDPEKKFLFRSYDDGTLRAFFTEEYQPINNFWYLERIQKLLPGGRVSHWRGNVDEFYGNILIPDSIRNEYDGEYGAMISCGNSEIGTRAFEQAPSLFRAICMNGCIWDKTAGKAIRVVHKRSHIDLPLLEKKLADNIHKQVELVPEILARFMDSRQYTLDKGEKMLKVIAQIGIDHKIPKGKKVRAIFDEYTQYEKGERNLFGLINSITRAAQNPEFSKDDWVQFDRLGGRLLSYDSNSWSLLRKRAASMEDKVLADTLGVSV